MHGCPAQIIKLALNLQNDQKLRAKLENFNTDRFHSEDRGILGTHPTKIRGLNTQALGFPCESFSSFSRVLTYP